MNFKRIVTFYNKVARMELGKWDMRNRWLYVSASNIFFTVSVHISDAALCERVFNEIKKGASSLGVFFRPDKVQRGCNPTSSLSDCNAMEKKRFFIFR